LHRISEHQKKGLFFVSNFQYQILGVFFNGCFPGHFA
jgi:hypothetical protein